MISSSLLKPVKESLSFVAEIPSEGLERPSVPLRVEEFLES
jgi:hypothetical protein